MSISANKSFVQVGNVLIPNDAPNNDPRRAPLATLSPPIFAFASKAFSAESEKL